MILPCIIIFTKIQTRLPYMTQIYVITAQQVNLTLTIIFFQYMQHNIQLKLLFSRQFRISI